MFRHKQIKIALAILLFASLACNIPSNDPSIPDPDPTIANEVEPEPSEVYQPDVPTEDTLDIIETNLPTVTMNGGSGYIFSTQSSTSGQGADRDIWWNSVEFIMSRSSNIISLGEINSPSEVTQISISETSDNNVRPAIGEGFAIRIVRDGTVTYAIIRILTVTPFESITFDWIYPYVGQVLDQ